MSSSSPAQGRIDQRHPHFCVTPSAERSPAYAPDLATLQTRLLQIVEEQPRGTTTLREFLTTALRLINAHRVQYLEVTESGELVTVEVASSDESHMERFDHHESPALAAAREQRVRITRRDDHVMIAVPVTGTRNRTDAIEAAVTMRYGEVEPLVVSLQLVATHVTLWELQRHARQLDHETQLACGLTEIIGGLQAHHELAASCLVTATKLSELLSGAHVAIGLRRGRAMRLRLRALSSHSEFDARGEITGAIESAMMEACLRDKLTTWPPTCEAERGATLCQKLLAELVQCSHVWSMPLKTPRGKVVGAVTVMGSNAENIDGDRAFTTTAAPFLASSLETSSQLRGGQWRQLAWRIAGDHPWARVGQFVVACVLVAGLLALPIRHKIKCDAVVEPTSRRFAVAPYAGVLKQTYAKPGDVVKAQARLAVMDDRELNWELAGLIADRDRAAKQRDSNLASKQVAEMQMAQLEVQRLQLKIELLEHRKRSLEIRSPVDGVVIVGDLENARGAPVESGQALFELAALDELRFDIEIPEHDISYVHHGMRVELRPDAFPSRMLPGTITHLHPRAEVSGAQNVFLAEVEVPVVDDTLRPGMKGRAHVVGPRRSLGWILFHRPWYRLLDFVR